MIRHPRVNAIAGSNGSAEGNDIPVSGGNNRAVPNSILVIKRSIENRRPDRRVGKKKLTRGPADGMAILTCRTCEVFATFWRTTSGNRAPSAILLGFTDITFVGAIYSGFKFRWQGMEISHVFLYR